MEDGERMAAPILLGLSLYVWIALISLLFLIVLVALGGYGLDIGGDVDADVDMDLDYGDFSGPGISPLSLPLVAAFGTTFGAVGALAESAGATDIITALSATGAAVLIAGAMYWAVGKFLVRAQASTEVKPATLIGRDAQVTVPIQPGAQGQILVITEERGRSLFPALGTEDIPRDAIVEITGFTGGVANVRKKVG